MNRAASLVDEILASPAPGDLAELANELLSEYHRGSDVSSLRKLLRSGDDKVAACGAWIAAELGELGKPLVLEVRRLLRHPFKNVRFWAIECVQEWAGSSNADELALTISLVGDSEEAVRWKAMGFLALAPRAQLEDAVMGFVTTDPGSLYLKELQWVLGPDATDPSAIITALEDTSFLHREIAAVAACRIAENDLNPLRLAASSEDPEIAQFAKDMLTRVRPHKNEQI